MQHIFAVAGPITFHENPIEIHAMWSHFHKKKNYPHREKRTSLHSGAFLLFWGCCLPLFPPFPDPAGED
ncbi:hypothetical protein EUGRSUZ_B03959 [Eucalyptus grandis]|uniref:Uncharacterized protein n=2 Tax=Eucalyptus grandis TaxID=71139 RepID=A0ACC3LZJ4_EUCGR|nr:hypothetical protein EUGRSUZ_B03959 [Eucalyptus grandis]